MPERANSRRGGLLRSLAPGAVLVILVAVIAGCAAPPGGVTRTSGGPAAAAGPATPGWLTGPSSPTSPTASTSTPPPPPPPELPRGGREVFPRYRLVGFSGAPGSEAFGRLGIGDLGQRAREIEQVGAPYAVGREVLPVLELIAVVAQGSPGPDGAYRYRMPDDVVQQYLQAARSVHGILLLNIQPGRSTFLPEVRSFERWLKEPDVGVALDPEWAVGPTGVPGRAYGSTTGAELDGVAAYLSALVAQHNLPQKVMVFHQVAPSVVLDLGQLQDHSGVAVVRSVDGIGTYAEKATTWNKIMPGTPPFVHPGFKLFYDEDGKRGPLMTPAQVLGLSPTPEYVLYE